MFALGVTVTVAGITLISCGGEAVKVTDDWDHDQEGFEMGGSNKGPDDPLESNIFAVDLAAEEKAYISHPVATRLVLI